MTEQTLRRVLWADVVGSGIATIFTIAGAAIVAGWLDIPTWIPLVVGIGLIPWVHFLYRSARREQLSVVEVGVIVAGNLGWAAAAAIVIVAFPDALSTAGKWIVGIFSLAVLDFGIAELVGLRTLTGSRHPARIAP